MTMILLEGKPLPEALTLKMPKDAATTGAVHLPGQMILMTLADYRRSDRDEFLGPARFRVSRQRSFMMLSPAFKTFSFDIIWSPAIARESDEPAPEAMNDKDHLAFTFVLLDGAGIVRGIRVATLSPACGAAMHRAREELMAANVTRADMNREMQDLFARHPRGFPDIMFHETCNLGD